MVRDFNLKGGNKKRADQVPDVPGDECQHDTSPYTIKIGNVRTRIVASLLYYRYSKVRYLKFSRSFTRFHMKCFFHEALNYFEYVPKTCIIDNTNLAVWHGTGKNAVFAPEMTAFAKMFGFEWQAHAIKHSDRKAGNERGFWTLETNFFPGREFNSFEDLNRQAFEWMEKRAKKPVTKSKIIPADAFEYEKPYMKQITKNLPSPYIQHIRTVDQYGYIAFNANYFWVPHTASRDVIVLEYSERLVIYSKRKMVAEYQLPAIEVKNEKFIPEGVTIRQRPNNRKFASQEEEKKLRSMDVSTVTFLEQGILASGGPKGKHRFIKGLYSLTKKVAPSILDTAISRAIQYQVYDLNTLSNICRLMLQDESFSMPQADIDFDFEKRDSYQEGQWSDEPDLDKYNYGFIKGDGNEEI